MTTKKKFMYFFAWLGACAVNWGLAVLAMPMGYVLAMNALKFMIPLAVFFAIVLSYAKSQREKAGNTDPLLDNVIPIPIRTLEGLAFAVLLAAYAHYVFAVLAVLHTLLEVDIYKTNGRSGV